MFIYKITNPKGKVYIGQSSNITRRFNSYKNLECKNQTKLYRSLVKYGVQNHIFEILENCIDIEGNSKERLYQEQYNSVVSGLNCKLTTTKDKSGRLSEETKLKISNSHKGKFIKPESILKMINTRNRKNLNKHSDQTKRKISNTLKGHEVTESTRKKISDKLKYRPNLKLSKAVIQYDLDGNLIKEFVSLSEAKKLTGILNIIKCIKGDYKTAGGFIWRYA